MWSGKRIILFLVIVLLGTSQVLGQEGFCRGLMVGTEKEHADIVVDGTTEHDWLHGKEIVGSDRRVSFFYFWKRGAPITVQSIYVSHTDPGEFSLLAIFNL